MSLAFAADVFADSSCANDASEHNNKINTKGGNFTSPHCRRDGHRANENFLLVHGCNWSGGHMSLMQTRDHDMGHEDASLCPLPHAGMRFAFSEISQSPLSVTPIARRIIYLPTHPP